MLGWLVVLSMIMLFDLLKLFIFERIWLSVCLCLLCLLLIFVLCLCLMELILLMKMMVGVFLWVFLNRVCIWLVFMFMNIFMNFEVFIEKKGMLVLLVIVWVSSVLFVLGGFISSMFLGILVLIWWYLVGFFRKFMILISLCLVFLCLVMLVNLVGMWFFLLYFLVLFWLNCMMLF